MLTAKEISTNWDTLINIIMSSFNGERQKKLLIMYEHFKERMAMAPASMKIHFHSCYAGGYVQHILNVYNNIQQISTHWESLNSKMKDYTTEQMIFVALHHDLGKIGDKEFDNYIPNESEWHMKNQGLMYKMNPNIQYMDHTQRAFFVLQSFGIQIDYKEYLAILLHDGMYQDGNKAYLMPYDPGFKVKTSLPFILHSADMMSSEFEYWSWKLLENEKTPLEKIKQNEKPILTSKPYRKKVEQQLTDTTAKKISETFNNLFNGS